MIEKKILIGGEWQEAQSGERFDVVSPGDGKVIGSVPNCDREDTQKAIEAAQEGRQALKKMSMLKRIELLHNAIEIAKKKDKETCEI